MNAPKKPPLTSIGQLIDADEFHSLKTGFAAKFPEETASVFLSKQTILDCIATYPGLSGISFRYGLGDVSDPLSRKIILVPCEHTRDAAGTPDHRLFREGYVNSDGNQVSLDQFWALLGNHVERAYNGKHHFVLSKIHRGYFWGIDRIRALLDQDQCGGLNFHFGYHATHPSPYRRNQNMLEVVDANRQSLHIYMEYGQCAPPCIGEPPPGGEGAGGTGICFTKELLGAYGEHNAAQQLNQLRAFRDDHMLEQPDGYALYEMYYYLSRPILRSIQALPHRDQIWYNLYSNEMQQVLALITEQRMEEVTVLYKKVMQQLLDTYVLAKKETLLIS